jgi:lysophospholipase-2
MGLMVLLSGELERLRVRIASDIGGFIGMSGWLPFRKQLSLVSGPKRYAEVVGYVRALLMLEPLDKSLLGIEGEETMCTLPIWLGTGEEDAKVKLDWGREMEDVIVGLGMEATLTSYRGLGHWWCDEEISELREVLRAMLEP